MQYFSMLGLLVYIWFIIIIHFFKKGSIHYASITEIENLIMY